MIPLRLAARDDRVMQPAPIPGSGPPYPGEPAVLQLLPREVEFTFIKMILEEVPDALTTALWVDNRAADDLSKQFQGKTYGATDRALTRAEADLAEPPIGEPDERRRVRALRHAWVLQALGETGGLPLKPGVKWMETTWTDPARLGVPSTPTGVEGPALVIEVRQLTRRGPVTREHSVLPATLMPWRPGGVPWVDPDFVDQLYALLIRTHFRSILARPVGHRWRSRRAAAGWPVLTQHVIPRLYEYLRPYYEVRRYRDRRQSRASGHYPAALRRDMTDLIAHFCPHLAEGLTIERVTSAIQRHVRRADPNRPIGIDVFRVSLPVLAPDEGGNPGRK